MTRFGKRNRLAVWLLAIATLGTTTAACLERGRRDEPEIGAAVVETTDEVAISLVGLEPPAGVDEAIVAFTVEHVALYDIDRKQWVPVLVEPVETELLFETGYSDPALVTIAPLLAGNYTDVEIVVKNARLITEDGETEVRTDDFACYTPLNLNTRGIGALHEIELLVSGPDALERPDGDWRFRPALVGSMDRSSNHSGPEFNDPSCAAY